MSEWHTPQGSSTPNIKSGTESGQGLPNTEKSRFVTRRKREVRFRMADQGQQEGQEVQAGGKAPTNEEMDEFNREVDARIDGEIEKASDVMRTYYFTKGYLHEGLSALEAIEGDRKELMRIGYRRVRDQIPVDERESNSKQNDSVNAELE